MQAEVEVSQTQPPLLRWKPRASATQVGAWEEAPDYLVELH